VAPAATLEAAAALTQGRAMEQEAAVTRAMARAARMALRQPTPPAAATAPIQCIRAALIRRRVPRVVPAAAITPRAAALTPQAAVGRTVAVEDMDARKISRESNLQPWAARNGRPFLLLSQRWSVPPARVGCDR
jgi:hypothetical protein